MRCPHCQKNFPGRPNTCPSCSKPIDWAMLDKKKRRSSFVSSLLFSAVCAAAGAYYAPTNATAGMLLHAAAAVSALFLLVSIMRLARTGISKLAHGRRFMRLFLNCAVAAAALSLIWLGYAGIVQLTYINMAASITNLQNTAAEATMAKLIGDSIRNGTAGLPSFSSMVWVSDTAKIRADWLERLSPNSRLADYQEALAEWAGSIQEAASSPSTWKNLPPMPSDFTLTINTRQASILVLNSVRQLAVLKQFGDLAIKNEDRQAMRYIAAKLLLQKHLIAGLRHSDDPGFFGKALGKTAYAYDGTPRTICYYNKPYLRGGTISYCAEDAEEAASTMYTTADAYAQGDPNGEQLWNNMPDDEVQYLLGCYGCVFAGEPDREAEYSPEVQSFIDDCHRRGGTIGGAGTVKTRMPTTESGYTCVYNHGGTSCWDMLTYSGGYYAGGNRGCPEANLLPLVVVEPPEPDDETDGGTNQATNKPAETDPDTPAPACDIDGHYTAQGTFTATSNLPQLNFSQNQQTNLEVRNNALIAADGSAYSIGSDGYVQLGYAVPSDSLGGADASVTYHFYCSGGKALVAGSFSGSSQVSDAGLSVVIQFSGSLAGSKISD